MIIGLVILPCLRCTWDIDPTIQNTTFEKSLTGSLPMVSIGSIPNYDTNENYEKSLSSSRTQISAPRGENKFCQHVYYHVYMYIFNY